MTHTFPNSHFISVIDDAAGKMCSVFNNVLTLLEIEQTNQTVMTQKLQKLQNKQRGGGAILYRSKNIAQISRSPRKKVP